MLTAVTLLAASSLSLASLASLGCSSSISTPPGDASPAGTYTRCAEGTYVPGSYPFLESSGYQSNGAALTLEQKGSTLSATYGVQNGETSTFDFARTSSTSATFTSAGHAVPGFVGSCTMGPGDSWTYPAVMDAAAGALTYDEGTVFVLLQGTVVQPDAGGCGAGPAPGGFWLVCDEREGGAPSPEPTATAAPPSAAHLPAGDYACVSQVGMYDVVGSLKEYSTSGGHGTLTLTQAGAEVTAAYSGDASVAGTLHLLATTATTASAEANQSVTAPCTVPIPTGPTGGPSPTPVTLPLAAGSLAVVGSTLFISFTGTMEASSSCPGALAAMSLICSKP